MINNDQEWSFVALFAQAFPVLNNFVEMCQVWNRVPHLDEDVQTCANMANYGILYPAMLTDGQLD